MSLQVITSYCPHHYPDPAVTWEGDILKPRGLSIYWGNVEKYWIVPHSNEDDEPAELKLVWTLDVEAKKAIDPRKTYRVGFKVSLAKIWPSNSPVFVTAKRGKTGNTISRKVDLERQPLNEKFDIPNDFVIKFWPIDDSEDNLFIGLYDLWTNEEKNGLRIHHAFVTEVERMNTNSDTTIERMNSSTNTTTISCGQFVKCISLPKTD